MRAVGFWNGNKPAMMTPAQYDRLERLTRLLGEACAQDVRKSRQQTKKLKRWVAARQECDAAEQAAEELPEDIGRRERLLRAREVLDQARQDLKH
jgi:ubiquinone biosynthesis protein UbiJ